MYSVGGAFKGFKRGRATILHIARRARVKIRNSKSEIRPRSKFGIKIHSPSSLRSLDFDHQRGFPRPKVNGARLRASSKEPHSRSGERAKMPRKSTLRSPQCSPQICDLLQFSLPAKITIVNLGEKRFSSLFCLKHSPRSPTVFSFWPCPRDLPILRSFGQGEHPTGSEERERGSQFQYFNFSYSLNLKLSFRTSRYLALAFFHSPFRPSLFSQGRNRSIGRSKFLDFFVSHLPRGGG